MDYNFNLFNLTTAFQPTPHFKMIRYAWKLQPKHYVHDPSLTLSMVFISSPYLTCRCDFYTDKEDR